MELSSDEALQLKQARRTRAPIGSPIQLEGVAQVELRLSGILKDLARILVSNGYGMAGFHKIAKRAFFEAATELDEESGRARNFARTAAATGLTRAEVSKFSRAEGPEAKKREGIPVSRAQRVSLAWTTDTKYLDEKGRPMALPFAGRKPSFGRLVKENSGDIPAKAMLSEMLRLGMVKEGPRNLVRLIRVDAPLSRRTTTSLRALSPWMKFLSQRDPGEGSELHANSVQVTLRFESLPQLFAAVREVQSRATAFAQTIQELGTPGKSKKRHELDVSFALGTRVSHLDDVPAIEP